MAIKENVDISLNTINVAKNSLAVELASIKPEKQDDLVNLVAPASIKSPTIITIP